MQTIQQFLYSKQIIIILEDEKRYMDEFGNIIFLIKSVSLF